MNSRSTFTSTASCTGVATAKAGHKRVLSIFCVLALALVALVALPAGANAAFGVSGFSYTNSSTQASGHPNVDIAFNRTGSESEDLKDIQLDLPTGVFANPEAANTKCTTAQFNADTCPANAQVGTINVTVKALSLLDLDIAGSIDVITPEANQVATLGLTLRPEKICIVLVFCAQPNKIFLKTGITVKSYEDSGLRTYTPGQPKTAVIGIPLVFVTPTINGDITINKLKLSFQARAGTPVTKCNWLGMNCTTTPPSGPYFFRQTGSCLPATATVRLISYQNATADAASTFNPTGCKTSTAASTVPFRPTMATIPANTAAGASTALKFQLNIPEADADKQDALPKIVDLDFPAGSGLDLNALSGVTGCTEDQLKARACPASSIIGTADAFSKYLPGATATTPGLVGKVYAMGVGNQIPVGVELVGPRNTIIIFRGTLGTRGDANAGTGRVYATFDRIPQLPYASFSMNITKTVFKNPVPVGCTNGALQTTTGVITGFDGSPSTGGNGTVVNRTATYPISACPTTPNTTITAGPSTTVPTSNTTPPFSFTSTVAGSTFQCAMDSNAEAAFAPCSSPFTPAPLTQGPHTFYVRAVNAGLVDPTPASLAFTVQTATFTITPSIVPSTTQARAHPDVAASFNVTGGNPQKIALTLPEGFVASLSAVTPCAAATAAAGNCTAASQVGTGEVTVSTLGGPQTGVGQLYLTTGPTGADAGGVSIKVPLAAGTFIAQAGAYLTNNGKTQTIEFRSIPQVVGASDVTITNLKTNFSGANAFITNPSSCAASSGFQSSGTSYAGNPAGAFNVPFTATGCATVPFNPTISQTLTSPVAGTTTGVNANLTLGPDNAGIKTLRVNEPSAIGPNFPSFGTQADQCPASAAPSSTSVFDPSGCPAQALVGSMTINTPLLPTPLTGSIYLINKSPLPWLGVKFDQPGISVRLTGVTSTPQVDPACDPLEDPNGFCQTQISILFNNVPDVPISSIGFVLDGPNRTGVGGVVLSSKILTVATANDPTCLPTTTANSTFTPFSGTGNVARSQDIAISGCQ